MLKLTREVFRQYWPVFISCGCWSPLLLSLHLSHQIKTFWNTKELLFDFPHSIFYFLHLSVFEISASMKCCIKALKTEDTGKQCHSLDMIAIYSSDWINYCLTQVNITRHTFFCEKWSSRELLGIISSLDTVQ